MTTASLSTAQRQEINSQLLKEFTRNQIIHYGRWNKAQNKESLEANVRLDGESIDKRMRELREQILNKEANKTWKEQTRTFEVISWGVDWLKTGALGTTLAVGGAAYLLRSRPLFALAATIVAVAGALFARDLYQTQNQLTYLITILNQEEPELAQLNFGLLVQGRIQELMSRTLFVKGYLKRQVVSGDEAAATAGKQIAAAYMLFAQLYLYSMQRDIAQKQQAFAQATKRFQPLPPKKTDKIHYEIVWHHSKAFSGFLSGAQRIFGLLGFIAFFASFFASYGGKPFLTSTLRVITVAAGIMCFDLRTVQKSTRLLSRQIEAFAKTDLDKSQYKTLSETFASIRKSSYIVGTLYQTRLVTVECEILNAGPQSIEARWSQPQQEWFGDFPCWKNAAEYTAKSPLTLKNRCRLSKEELTKGF